MLTQTYQIDHIPSMLNRIWRDIKVLLLTFTIFFVIGICFLDKMIALYTSLCFPLPYLFSFLDYKNYRQIKSVQFDVDQNSIKLEYFRYKVHIVFIPFSSLDFTYRKEVISKTEFKKALSFYKDEQLVARIVEKQKNGWSIEKMQAMYQQLLLIKEPNNKVYY